MRCQKSSVSQCQDWRSTLPTYDTLKEWKTFLLFFIWFFHEFIELLSSFLEFLYSLVKEVCKVEQTCNLMKLVQPTSENVLLRRDDILSKENDVSVKSMDWQSCRRKPRHLKCQYDNMSSRQKNVAVVNASSLYIEYHWPKHALSQPIGEKKHGTTHPTLETRCSSGNHPQILSLYAWCTPWY